MKTKFHRRTFLKRGAMLGGGLLLLGAKAQSSRAAGAETNPAGGAASPANETLKTIRNLRTIHGNFLDQPLPEAALQTILQASVRAANASNNQSYSIIVVKDRKRMSDVCGYQGGCLLVYCADFNRIQACAEALGHPYDPGTIENFVTATINTLLAAQTAVIAARSLGIDSLLTNGVHRGDMERHWTLLDLPRTHCFPVIALVLGYPTREPAFKKGRLTGAGVVHNEKYHRLTRKETDEIIREYDDMPRHLDLNEDWAAAGYKHYLDWFFEEWVGRNKQPPGETQMLRFLKRSGFVEPQKT
jgi:nitroreductase